jgi:hypothetical protein
MNAPTSLFVVHAIRGEIKRASGQVLAQLELYRGDHLNSGFSDKYGSALWAAPNVVRFPRRIAYDNAGSAQLVITNESDAQIDCLKINAGDLFLIMDLPPRTVVVVPASAHLPGELVFLAARSCTTTHNLKPVSTDFELLRPHAGWHGRYLVSFTARGLTLALDPPQPGHVH